MDEQEYKIPKQLKPSKATSTYESMPVLRHGYVDGGVLHTTDSYQAARVPLPGIPDGTCLSPVTLKALDKATSYIVRDDGLKIDGAIYEFEQRPEGHPKFPDLENLGHWGNPNGYADEAITVGFNPKLLAGLAEALGHRKDVDHVALTFHKNKPGITAIKVRVGKNEGILMPVRINQ